jgi:26S proteasome regulatory subunit T2
MGNMPPGIGGEGPPHGGGGASGNNNNDPNNKDGGGDGKKKKKRFEPRPAAGTRQGRRRRRKGPSGLNKVPTITPSSKCKLRMLKLDRVKDFLLLEEEFIRNHEVFKPSEERDQEEREKLEELRGSPLGVGSLEELIDDNHAIVSSSVGAFGIAARGCKRTRCFSPAFSSHGQLRLISTALLNMKNSF